MVHGFEDIFEVVAFCVWDYLCAEGLFWCVER